MGRPLWTAVILLLGVLTVARAQNPPAGALLVPPERVAAVRAAAASPRGQKLLQRMDFLSDAELAQRDRISEAGYQAAGHAALFWLTGASNHAARAAEFVLKRILTYPLEAQLTLSEQSARLMGMALAYDLCRDTWSADTRARVAAELDARARRVLELAAGDRREDNVTDVLAAGAAGVAALARLGESGAPDDTRAVADAAAAQVGDWLAKRVSAAGCGVEGEGLKQVALAGGVLPLEHAWRARFGKPLLPSEHLEAMLRAFAMQTVVGQGTVRFENSGGVLDRTGLLALSFDLVRPEFRPELAWFFAQVIPVGHEDVARPIHGLLLLKQPVWDVVVCDPAALDPAGIAHSLADRDAGLFAWRKGWGGGNDALAVINLFQRPGVATGPVYAGDLRVTALGGRWIAHPGLHSSTYAPRWLHQRGILGYPARDATVTFTGEARLLSHDARPDGSGSIAIERKGRVRAKSALSDKKDEARPREDGITNAVDSDFVALRALAVDYSGQSGAPAVYVLLDRMTAPDGRPLPGQQPTWTLHTEAWAVAQRRALEAVQADFRGRFMALDEKARARDISLPEHERLMKETEVQQREAERAARATPLGNPLLMGTGGEATGQLTYATLPDGVPLRIEGNPPYWNGLVLDGVSQVIAVLTVVPGARHPDVVFESRDGAPIVRIGGRVIRLDGQRLVLEP